MPQVLRTHWVTQLENTRVTGCDGLATMDGRAVTGCKEVVEMRRKVVQVIAVVAVVLGLALGPRAMSRAASLVEDCDLPAPSAIYGGGSSAH